MQIKKGRGVFFTFLFFAFFLFPSCLYAFKIVQLDRAKIRLILPAGESKSGRIEVKNDDSSPKQVKAYFEDWNYENSTGSKTFYPAGSTKYSCAKWISYAPAEFTVPPFGKQYINYVVKVPPEAAGGYYAVLFCESEMGQVGMPPETPEVTTETTVSVPVSIRVGSLFYLEAAGTVKRNVKLDNLSVERKSEDEPLSISMGLENIGNADITAGGNYNIIDKKGVVLARGEFKDVYTFPGDKAKLSSIWKEPIPTGTYDLIITLDLGKSLEELGMGRGPIITKEAQIEIGGKGEIIKVGDLK